MTRVNPRQDIRICEKKCITFAYYCYDVSQVIDDKETDEENKGILNISTVEKNRGLLERITKSPKRIIRKALEMEALIKRTSIYCK